MFLEDVLDKPRTVKGTRRCPAKTVRDSLIFGSGPYHIFALDAMDSLFFKSSFIDAEIGLIIHLPCNGQLMGLLEDPHLLFQVPGIFSRQRCLKAKGVQLGLDGLDLPSLIPDFEGGILLCRKAQRHRQGNHSNEKCR